MHLHHLHLPSLTRYPHPINLQSNLITAHLAHKPPISLSLTAPPPHPPPPPTLLTFQTYPTYTCGRREIATLSPSQITYLRANHKADFYESLRGGQTTFHGPGQLTAFLVLDLRAHGLSPRAYVRLLETVLIATCAHYRISSFTTSNPGVWTSPDDKIASLGVHLRRGITGFGVGLNVSTELKWFERIVACGLVGKRTTSFEKEGVGGVGVEEVGKVLADLLAKELRGVDGVKRIEEAEVQKVKDWGEGDRVIQP